MTFEIDQLITDCLHELAADTHVRTWSAKERDWVNYFVHRFLLKRRRPDGVLHDAAQVAIEVGVAQPPGYVQRAGAKKAVSRDLVIWRNGGDTCWDEQWNPKLEPQDQPLAIVEWKVHRPRRLNRDVKVEQQWLEAYCAWQPATPAYSVRIDWLPSLIDISCTRFLGMEVDVILEGRSR